MVTTTTKAAKASPKKTTTAAKTAAVDAAAADLGFFGVKQAVTHPKAAAAAVKQAVTHPKAAAAAVKQAVTNPKAVGEAVKKQASRPQVKAALGLFSIYSDFATSLAFFSTNILGSKYQSTSASAPVTAVALFLIVLNTLLGAFITQYTLGVEFVSKKRMKLILHRGHSGPGKPDKYQQRMALKASVKHNAFLPAIQVGASPGTQPITHCTHIYSPK
jgi:hypothetical protein